MKATITIPDALMLYGYNDVDNNGRKFTIADVTRERNYEKRDKLLREDTLTDREHYNALVYAAFDVLDDLLEAKMPDMKRTEHMQPDHYAILKHGYVEYYKKFKELKDKAYERSQRK